MILREQVGTGLRELHEGPAFMQFEPAEFNRAARPAAYSAGVPLSPNRNGAVDLFDVDAAILHRLEGAGVIHQPARGFVRISEWSVGGVLHRSGTGSPRSRSAYFRAVQSRCSRHAS